MKKDILQMAKGTRDFGSEDKMLRNRITDLMGQVFESFGYRPIETPIIERYDLFASKFGQGEQSDSMKETFKLTDQGERSLVLRNEFTVPLARYVGSNPNLKMPFKRYQMGQIFRDGPIKLGRYREFWQCDIDIVGNKNVSADAEILMAAQVIFKELELDVSIYLNNRKILNAVLNKFDVPAELQDDVIISIDKLDKIGVDGVIDELKEKKIETGRELLELLSFAGSNEEKIKKLQEVIGENDGLEEIQKVLDLMPDNTNVVFQPSLARGLVYYTGNVFEIALKDQSKIKSSLAGGGRYDEMIGGFVGSKEGIPAVGIGIGLETIMDAIKLKDDIALIKTYTNIFVIPMGEENLKASIKIADDIRVLGYNVDIDLMNRKVKKNFDYANDMQIPYVVVIGSDEVKNGKITIKNMETGQQETIEIQSIGEFVTKE